MKKKIAGANFFFWFFAFLTLWLAQDTWAQAFAPREVYRQAMELFKSQDYEKSIPLLEQSVETYTLLQDHALYYLAESLSQNGQQEEALKRFNQLPRTFPESIWAERSLVKQGDVLMEMGKIAAGREAYSRFLEVYPHSSLVPETLLKLALGYIKESNYEEARKRLVSLGLDYPLTSQAIETKRLVGQMEAARKVEKREPPIELWFRQASTFFEAGRFTMAIAELKAINSSAQLKAKPTLVREVLLKLGQALMRARQWVEAKSVLTRTMKSYPQTEQGQAALYWLGRLALRQDRKEEAQGLFEQLIKKFPRSDHAVETLLSLGQMAEEEGDAAKATALYQRVLTEYADRPDAQAAKWRLSRLDYITGEFARAAQGFKELADASIDSYRFERATFWQGKALEKMGAFEQAVKLYLELIQQAPLSYHGFRAWERIKVLGPEKAGLGFTLKAHPEGLARKGPRSQGNLPTAREDNLHLQKAKELASIDLKGDAARELNRVLLQAISEKGLILPVSQLYLAMGNYNRSHLVIRQHFAEALKQVPTSGEEGLYWQLAYPRAFEPLVLKYARENNLPPSLVYAVMREESAFDPLALSRSGAMGLMQIIPPTGRQIAAGQGLRPFDSKGLYEPEISVQFGAWYLGRRLEQYAFEKTLALAAYNAGAGAVNKWLAEKGYTDPDLFVEQIPYDETRGYVQRVLKSYFAYQTLYGASQP